MTQTCSARVAAFLSVTILLLLAGNASAVNRWWDTSAGLGNGVGGSGVWGTTFSTTATGDAVLTTAANADDDIFQGTAGTITLAASQTANTLTFNTNGYVITTSGSTTRVLTGPIILTNNVTLTLAPTNTAALTVANSITGATNSGLVIGGSATSTNDAIRVNLGSGAVIASSAPIAITTTGTLGIAGFVSSVATATISANITNNSSVATMLGATAGNTLNIGGVISGSAGVQFAIGASGGGAGTVNLNTANTYAGPTIFNLANNGTVSLGVDNAIPTGSAVTMAATAGDGGVLDLGGNNQTLASLTSGVGGGGITDAGFTPSTDKLTINGSAATTFGLVISDGNHRKIALTRAGSGATTLTAANTYSGNTIIKNSATLAIGAGGSIAKTPQVSIASGATFDVSAAGFTFAGGAALTTQQMLAGSSVSGTANIKAGTGTTNVTLNNGALLSFEASGGATTTVGKISVTGDLTLNANAVTVDVSGLALASGSYRLLDCTGTLANSGVFGAPTISGTALSSGYTAAISVTTGSAGHVDLVVNAMPTFSGLTASPGISYGATNVILSGTVSSTNGVMTVYPASGDTVSATINGHLINGTVINTAGGFTINYNDASLATNNVGSYAITYGYVGNSAQFLNAATNNATTTLTVSKAVLTYTANPASMTYGAVVPGLSGTVIGFVNGQNQASATTGILTFTTAATSGSPVGSYAINGGGLSAANYSFVQAAGNATALTINKATPLITTLPTATAITYGQTLASSGLSGGVASVAGIFAFTTSGIAPDAGSTNVSVTFTPTDTTNYNTATGTVTVTVSPQTPLVATLPTTTTITFGQTLASSVLSGGTATNAAGAAVGGTFAFTSPGIAPNAGSTNVSVIFTPTDTYSYNPTTAMVAVTVNPQTPLVATLPTATAITYGQTVASSTLSGGSETNAAGAAVSGSFAFNTPSIAPDAGVTNLTVTFRPTDSFDYATNTISIPVTVSPQTPLEATPPTASAITYGQTVGSSTLSGGSETNAAGAVVGGSYVFNTPNIEPDAGITNLTVTFRPTDSFNYATTTISINVTVMPATPLVATLPTATAITFGQTLASSVLSGGTVTNSAGAAVGGNFIFTTPSIAPVAGSTNVQVFFIPTNTVDYNAATTTVAVVVNPQMPLVATLPTATAITFGQTLASSVLSGGAVTNAAGAAVSGGFAFTTPGIAPVAGSTNVSVSFTPTDAVDYNALTTTVAVTVNKAGTSVAVGSTENPSGYRDGVGFTATLPAGVSNTAVSFLANGALFDTETLSAGAATSLSITNLPRGTNIITVQYAGDSNYLGSTNNLAGGQVVTNHPPAAGNTIYYRAKGTSLSIAISDLLTNVTDVDSDTNTVQSVGSGTNSAAITLNGTNILYVPGTGASSNSNDSFTYTVNDGYGGSATGNITVNVYATGLPQISAPTNGVASLKFFGIPNSSYVLQTTTNLIKPWLPLSTNTAAGDGSVPFTDPHATNSQQFYRTLQN